MVDIEKLMETNRLFHFCLSSLGVLVVAKIVWGFIDNALTKEVHTNSGAWVKNYTLIKIKLKI